MSDVINGVPRELLERIYQRFSAYPHRNSISQGEAIEELRALLTAQPQASAEIPVVDQFAAEHPVEWEQALDEIEREHAEPQASAAQSAHHCNNCLGVQPESCMFAQSAPAGEREAELVSALEHIAKTCNRSRTSTRRLRWIEQRAKWAIEGKPYDRDAFDLPKDGGSTAHKLSLEVARLKAELAEVQRTQSAGVPECVQAWYDAKLAHVEAVDAYNARLEFIRQHMPFGTSADPEYQITVEAEKKERELRRSLFSGLREWLAAAPAQPAAQDQGHPMQPVVIAPDGVIRFKQNKIVRHLLDFASPLGCSLNELAREDFSHEDRMQLAQLIGYSVSGYGDLSYASRESVERADAIADTLAASTGQEE